MRSATLGALSTRSLVAMTCVIALSNPAVATDDDPFGGAQSGAGNPFAATPAKQVEASAPKRIWIDADSEATERVLAVLDSDLASPGFEFTDAPLKEIVEFLRDEYSIEIHLDEAGLDDLGIGRDEPITISMRDVKLRVALSALLEPIELTYIAIDGYVVITSEEEALCRLQIAIYDVADLVRDGGRATYDSLVRTIESTIAPDTWTENSKGDAAILPFPERGALVISQTSEAHALISGLLGALSSRPAQSLTSDCTDGGGFGGEMRMGMMGGGFGEAGGRGFGGRAGGRRGVQDRE